MLAAVSSQEELVRTLSLGLSGVSKVDDVGRSSLVTSEEETLAGMSSPGNVVDGVLGSLLGLLVGLKSLGLNGVRAEEEELFAGNQVPRAELLAFTMSSG